MKIDRSASYPLGGKAGSAIAVAPARPDRTVRWDRLDFAALLLALVWLAAGAWSRPLMLPDEGRYVGVAWEMLRSGDWLTPRLNGLPFFHKPPLFYWITAAAMSVFGVNEWAARMAPMLGAFVGAASMYLFVRRWSDRSTALTTLLALLVQPLFYLGGQFANLDMLVAGLITATIVLLIDAVLRLENHMPNRLSVHAAYIAAALAVLAKGLIGFVIPALVLVVTLVAWRRLRLLWTFASMTGAATFALITVPWFLAMQTRYPAFMDYFFVEQHFRRFASVGFNNVQPFWFYPALLLLFSVPLWPWAWHTWRRAEAVAAASTSTRTPTCTPIRTPIRTLMWVWAAVVVGFFSLPASKLIGYVLPAVPALAFLAADAHRNFGTVSSLQRKLWWGASALLAMVGVGVVVGLSFHTGHSTKSLAQVLAAARAPHEPILMLERYAYDVGFYARLAEPVTVVDAWDDPDVGRKDNWRKEVADAGRFAPALAASNLLIPGRLVERLCGVPVTWIIGAADVRNRYPVLDGARQVTAQGDAVLWRLERAAATASGALSCPGTSNTEASDR